MAFQGCHGAKYRVQTLMIMDLATNHGSPTQKSLKKSVKWHFPAKIFIPRLRRAKRGFAKGTVPDSPESATLVGALIPARVRGLVPTPRVIGVGDVRLAACRSVRLAARQ